MFDRTPQISLPGLPSAPQRVLFLSSHCSLCQGRPVATGCGTTLEASGAGPQKSKACGSDWALGLWEAHQHIKTMGKPMGSYGWPQWRGYES